MRPTPGTLESIAKDPLGGLVVRALEASCAEDYPDLGDHADHHRTPDGCACGADECPGVDP